MRAELITRVARADDILNTHKDAVSLRYTRACVFHEPPLSIVEWHIEE